MSEIYLLIITIGLLLWIALIIWAVIPALYGLPWIPSELERIQTALELANLQPDEKLYDLGAGDGRVLIVGARDFQAQSVGIEIGPLHCLLAKYRAKKAGIADKISVQWGSFFSVNLSAADVVFIYARSKQVARLQPVFEKQLKVGARVVSLAVDLPGWRPDQVDSQQAIFVYQMPPKPGSVEQWFENQTF
jgi:hypothetical protein